MMGLIKGIFYICLVLLVLTIGGIIFLAFFVNPNQYKSDIIAGVEGSTGRSLAIHGNMQWTFYPVFGVKVSGLVLSNPPSFPKTDFFSVKDAQISVAFLPLFKGQIQVGKIVLDNLKLNLIKNSSGQVNWQNQVVTSHQRVGMPLQQNNDHRSFKLALLTIGEVDLKDSSIVYDDQKQNKEIILDHLQLKSKNIAINKLFPVELETKFLFKDNKTSRPIDVKITANMLFNKDKFRLQDMDATTNQYHWIGWLEISPLDKMISGLNGNITFSGKNGAVQGIDLYYYSALADAMIHQTEPTRQDTHQTPFNDIQGTLDIQNGVVNNHDLLVEAQGINASGHGTANLVTQQLDYKVSLQRLTGSSEVKPRGPAIPLIITGTFSKPNIRPDWTSLVVTQVKSRIEAQIEKHKNQIPESIQKDLQGLLGN